MTASTQAASNSKADLKEMTRRAVQNLNDQALIYGDATVHTFADTYTVPTTAIDDVGDILRLFQYPPGAYITNVRITATDVDTNATPTLVFSLVVTDSADTVKATLIANSTIGQGAGSDSIDEPEIGEFVGSYYCAIKVGTAAATAAAGTLKLFTSYSIGVMQPSFGPNPRTTDAGV